MYKVPRGSSFVCQYRAYIAHILFMFYLISHLCVRSHREHPNGVRVGLQNSNLLLRSCTIRNTETVVGIVVYAGKLTK